MKSRECINAIESRHDWHLVFSVGRVFVESCQAWFVSGGRPGQCSSFAIERERRGDLVRYQFTPLDPSAGFKAICRLLQAVHYDFDELVEVVCSVRHEGDHFEFQGFRVAVGQCPREGQPERCMKGKEARKWTVGEMHEG